MSTAYLLRDNSLGQISGRYRELETETQNFICLQIQNILKDLMQQERKKVWGSADWLFIVFNNSSELLLTAPEMRQLAGFSKNWKTYNLLKDSQSLRPNS